MNGLTDTILKMMDTTQEPEDYKGEDGLLYCGKCHAQGLKRDDGI